MKKNGKGGLDEDVESEIFFRDEGFDMVGVVRRERCMEGVWWKRVEGRGEERNRDVMRIKKGGVRGV
ncbi:hypothetical protein [Bacillus altitudinis]|uniref:hypothetical protein n=1 Tax=Bacillus altitudinis TaxID=293387 RepID=UPI0011A21BCD|nr:hypothetical protein [Bacillus altitudinis]